MHIRGNPIDRASRVVLLRWWVILWYLCGMKTRMSAKWNRWLVICAFPGILGLGCRHDDAVRNRQNEQEQELDIVKARLHRLERRQSDLDSRLALMAEKTAATEKKAAVEPPLYSPLDAQEIVETDWLPGRKEQPPMAGIGLKSIDIGGAQGPLQNFPDAAAYSTDYFVPQGARDHEKTPQHQTVSSEKSDSIPRLVTSHATNAEPGDVVLIDSTTLQMPIQSGPDELYKWAHRRMEEGRYVAAIQAFSRIQEKFSDHHLADNALYWSAVAQERRGNHEKAVAQWEALPLQYPKSAKIPDALFHLADSFEKAGELNKAETIYVQLLEQYPRAEKTGDAKRALKRIRHRP